MMAASHQFAVPTAADLPLRKSSVPLGFTLSNAAASVGLGKVVELNSGLQLGEFTDSEGEPVSAPVHNSSTLRANHGPYSVTFASTTLPHSAGLTLANPSATANGYHGLQNGHSNGTNHRSSLSSGGSLRISSSVTGTINAIRNVERIFEDAQHTGDLNLSGRNMKDVAYPASGKYNLIDTIRADVSRNRLSELPSCLCDLVFVERLNCRENILRSLPDELSRLKCLVQLDLSRNTFTALPAVICGLPLLEILLVSHNRLQSLPTEIGKMKSLMELDASCNCLTELPVSLTSLSKFRSLDVRKNKLTALPDDLAKLHLVYLNVAENRLIWLPVSLRLMKTLQTLRVGDNPLENPPLQLCNRGQTYICKSLERSVAPVIPLNSAGTTAVLTKKTAVLGSPVGEKYPEFVPSVAGKMVSGNRFVNGCETDHAGNNNKVVTITPYLETRADIETAVKVNKESNKNDSKTSNFPVTASINSVPVTNGTSHVTPRETVVHEVTVVSNGVFKKDIDSNLTDGEQESVSSSLKTQPATSSIPRKISPTYPISARPPGSAAVKTAPSINRSAAQINSRNRAGSNSGSASGSSTPSALSSTVPATGRKGSASGSSTNTSGTGSGQTDGQAWVEATQDQPRPTNVKGRAPPAPGHDGPHTSAKPPVSASRLHGVNKSRAPESNVTRKTSWPATGSINKEKPRDRGMSMNTEPVSPTFTIRRQQEQIKEEKDKLDLLRKLLETRLKLSLPEDLLGALQDGVILCHLVNNIRPRSVVSIHVPTTHQQSFPPYSNSSTLNAQGDVMKLTPAKCRRNVDNFLDACRRLGVPDVILCASSDILEGKNASRILECVEMLNGLFGESQPSAASGGKKVTSGAISSFSAANFSSASSARAVTHQRTTVMIDGSVRRGSSDSTTRPLVGSSGTVTQNVKSQRTCESVTGAGASSARLSQSKDADRTRRVHRPNGV